MKKIIISPILFIAVCLLFSSCAQDFSGNAISKRHYRSGYHIALNNNKPVESKMIQSKKFIPDAFTLAVEEIKETTNDNVVENERSLNVEELPLVASATTDNSKQGTNATTTVPQKAKAIKTLLKNSSKIKETVSSVKDVKKGHRNGGLIWTIIVILLILWLLGFIIGGFGGLLYLLLVIALVLLILKILGII